MPRAQIMRERASRFTIRDGGKRAMLLRHSRLRFAAEVAVTYEFRWRACCYICYAIVDMLICYFYDDMAQSA